jgi:hypothetical protein
MADTYPFSHVGQYVLLNADDKFKDFKAGKPDKNGKYPLKKHTYQYKGKTRTSYYQQGKDFTEVYDGNGQRTQFSYDSGTSIDDDGSGGTPGDWSHQSDTSYKWDDGSNIDASQTNYVVLPGHASGPGGPYEGVQPGDYVTVTNPANGRSVSGIVADVGNYSQTGEMSTHMASDLGISPKNGLDMTDQNALHWDWYPGSGDHNGIKIKRQTNDEIAKNAKKVAEARSVKGGQVIIAGKSSVLISKQLMPAACVDPAVLHIGGCPMATGSDSVSVELCPATRVGDSCSCNKKVVSGDDTVQVGGACTSAKADPPQQNKFTPPSLFDYPQMAMPQQQVPGWAQSMLGPQQPQPSMFDMATQNYAASPGWPSQ